LTKIKDSRDKGSKVNDKGKDSDKAKDRIRFKIVMIRAKRKNEFFSRMCNKIRSFCVNCIEVMIILLIQQGSQKGLRR
jgi:hypothetical protein